MAVTKPLQILDYRDQREDRFMTVRVMMIVFTLAMTIGLVVCGPPVRAFPTQSDVYHQQSGCGKPRAWELSLPMFRWAPRPAHYVYFNAATSKPEGALASPRDGTCRSLRDPTMASSAISETQHKPRPPVHLRAAIG